jgi:hypothetical protein
MTALVVGDATPAGQLVESLRATGVDAQLDGASRDETPAGEIPALAAELVRLEGLLSDGPPSAVVLADASDRSLAAALVATKLLIPVGAAGIAASDGQNAGVLAQLADRKLSADPAEIAAWIAALPTLSR